MRVLVIGADGFIGRHIVFHLRDQGVEVLAQARDPASLAAMGFETLAADLANPSSHDAAFWASHLHRVTHLIYAAGLLTGTEVAFRAVHETAPRALLAALPAGIPAVLISAIGIEADTTFARWRRATEALFTAPTATILRPGLVLADTSYGGSSLLRALAALPVVTPTVGNGIQPFNPIHAADLADIAYTCLCQLPGTGPWQVGGPETLSQINLLRLMRRWLGLRAGWHLPLPLPLARTLGRTGDMLRLGPISATSVRQLEQGVLADPAPLLARIGARPRPVSQFVMARPAGTQDLWQAQLYLIKPLVRLSLAVLWLVSGLLGLFTPAAVFLPRLGDAVSAELAIAVARLGGLADLALGAALLRNWRPKPVALAQMALVAAYTLGLGAMVPGLWLDPFGGLLKNLPILALLLVHLALIAER